MFQELIHIARDVAVIIITAAINLGTYIGILEEHIAEEPLAYPVYNESPADTSSTFLETPGGYEDFTPPSTEGVTPDGDASSFVAPKTHTEEDLLSDDSEETSPPPDSILTTELNTRVRNSLVNILCTTRSGSGINASSGSGIIIDERGVILTNTHVAQYFLLEASDNHHGRTNCVVRGNAPAENLYDAIPLFLSTSWIADNAKTITQDHPRGTGEYDVALLLITESLTRDDLPNSFPFIPLTPINDSIDQGADVLVAGYPAEFLSGNVITRDLWPVTALTDILDVYTFTSHSIDVFSVAGNIAAQQGSSGGGIIDIEKESLSGIVVTSSSAEQTKERELNAVTHQHVNHTLFIDTGMALSTYLSGNLRERAEDFMDTTAPDLRATLLEIIEK